MAEEKSKIKKVIIVPGNGCTDTEDANWYSWMRDSLRKFVNEKNLEIEIVLPKCMPDPHVAKEKIWVPYLQNQLKADESTVVVGHSSGAEAAMRLAEKQKLAGIVLVSACYTDLGL